ncbi:MAG: choline kinase family protein [Halioglobus sp.]|nr:choline kinase family protein [Halioglobus sp.]
MTPDLPESIRLRLRQTLDQWRCWRCDPPLAAPPRAVAWLGHGHSNFSVRATAQQRQFVVRIDGINPAHHGLNRRAEWRSLQSAHAAGLAPCPRYFNPDLGSLVYDYLPADRSQPERVEDVGRLLRAIHRLPPRRHRLDLGERVRHYERLVERNRYPLPDELTATGAEIAALTTRAAREDPAQTLCHNDLLRSNRLYSGGRLFALDWEYCAMASPWYDLAVIAHGDELGETAAAQLATAYLEREPTDAEQMRLRHYGCIYRYLALLWYLATGREAIADKNANRQHRELRELLGRG